MTDDGVTRDGVPRDGLPRSGGSVWERHGWVMSAVWMVFLAYPVMGLVRSTADRGWVVAGWVGLVTFAVVYVAGFINGMRFSGGGLTCPPRPIQWVVFAVLLVCPVVTVPAVGHNALSFVPFVMAFASFGLTRTAHWVTLSGGITVTAVAVLFVPGGREVAGVLVIVVLLGIVYTVTTSLIIRSDEAERLGLELATSEGREAVARDVHDLVGHTLTVVRVKAQLARRLVEADPQRAAAELADIEELTAEAIRGVRESVAGVRGVGLVDQLTRSRDVLRSAGIALAVEGEAGALSSAQSLTAGWVLREATTNVLRHAAAGTVTVRVAPGTFVVTDDGVGFTGPEGNGVRGMRERATMAGATLTVGAGPRGGTCVELTW